MCVIRTLPSDLGHYHQILTSITIPFSRIFCLVLNATSNADGVQSLPTMQMLANFHSVPNQKRLFLLRSCLFTPFMIIWLPPRDNICYI